MVTPDVVRLTERLIIRTRDGKVNWTQTSDSGRFRVSFSQYSIEIEEAFSNRGTPIFLLTIRDEAGEVIDSFNDDELLEAREGLWYSDLRDTYALARANAMGLNKAVNDLLAELDDEELF